MADLYTEQLSAYLDGELDLARRRRLEMHLAACPGCSALLADLGAIVAAAPHYEGREASRDLWKDIEPRLEDAEVIPIASVRPTSLTSPSPPTSRSVFSWSQLIAASFVMAALGGGATWLAVRGGGPTSPTSPTSLTSLSSPTDSSHTVAYAEEQYDSAVRDLELILDAGRSRLDSATVNTIELSLQKIDAAIAEARTAVQRDPANAYLSRQIAANMRRKLNLLRAATNAIAART